MLGRTRGSYHDPDNFRVPSVVGNEGSTRNLLTLRDGVGFRESQQTLVKMHGFYRGGPDTFGSRGRRKP